MAQSLIRGDTQIKPGTIPLSALVAGYSIPSGNLVDGANFIIKTGAVAFTAAQSMGGFVLSNVADAVAAQDAVNLRTAQGLVNGIAIQRARVVATTNQALTGLPTIDSITLVDSQIVLLTANTTTSQNGPWAVHSGAWTRPANWPAASVQKSTLFFVEEGTTNQDTKWITITDAVTVDTTALVITQDQSGTSYTNGAGIGLAGNVFSINFGQGTENDGSSNLRVKLNGTSLSRGAAGIAIAPGTAAQIPVTNAGATDVAMVSLSGDVTMTSLGVASVNHTAGSGFLKYTDAVYNETPGGAINSSNTAFTLANTPQNSSLELFLNGQLLEPGSGNDYTVSGTAITALFAPTTGDKLRAYYAK